MTLPAAPDVCGPLVDALTALADTPDDDPDVGYLLIEIVRLASDRVAAAEFASVTALRGGAPTTVAASRDLIRAVEEAQYADGDGPCVQALRDEAPVAAPAIATVMRWPGFTREALRLGLRASVSVPLFVASGRAAAVLNLHGRDDAAMAPLIAGVWSIYDPDRELPTGDRLLPLDAGGRELLAGFAAAVAVRSVIQRALTVLADTEGRTVPDACRELFRRAVARGVSVRAAADGVLAGRS